MVNRKIFAAIAASLLIKATAASYAITGVQDGVDHSTGQRPFRQNFNNFQNAGPAFDLYVQAFQQFTATGQAAQLSYYQVAGIHGYPDIAWDGATGPDYSVGYCTHASILFPTWHRPYMALFEQILWNNAQAIAKTYPASTRQKYMGAARTFRIPYWDWAKNSTMPTKFQNPTMMITTPKGRVTVKNPFYTYTFHPHPSASDFPPGDGTSQYLSTVRYPTSSAPNAQSQNHLVNAQLRANQQSLHDLTYQLLASQRDYAPFSNTAYTDKNGNTYNSIENMHNIVHSLVGNGGHMSYIPYAAFDPIFWLHHANVDRLVAIWQALYSNSFTSPEIDQYGTYTNKPGVAEDIHTPLTPFHSDTAGTFYTSNTARHTRTFGYTYPEVVDWGVSAAQLSKNVRSAINKLYNPSGSLSTRSQVAGGSRIARNVEPRDGDLYPRVVDTVSADYQWAINLRSDTSKIPTSLFLHFYLTQPPTDPSLWSSTPSLIASLSITPPPPTKNTTTNTVAFTNGQLPLTHALLPYFPPSNLTAGRVLPLLKENLQWRAQKFDDSEISNEEVGTWGGVNVRLVGRAVRGTDTDEEFPVYGEWESLVNVTLGLGQWGLL